MKDADRKEGNRKRQQAYSARMRAAGYKRVCYWIHVNDKPRFDQYWNRVNRQRESLRDESEIKK